MSSSKKPDYPPREPEPAPAPLPLTEAEEAKRRTRRATGRGRPSTILAGRLMQRIAEQGKRVLG